MHDTIAPLPGLPGSDLDETAAGEAMTQPLVAPLGANTAAPVVRRDAQLTVARSEYGLGERAVNAVCGLSHRLGLPFTDLDLDPIVAKARSQTGLTDTSLRGDQAAGPESEERWRAGYAAFLRAVDAEPNIQPLARAAFNIVSVRAVRNRLKIQEYLRTHADALRKKVERPIFVLGFPRTGTTVLHNLLALEEDRRALEFWELTEPAPIYDDPTVDRTTRVRGINRFLDVAYRLAPEMSAIHEVRAETAEECWPIFYNAMAALNLDFTTGLRPFGDWLLEQDLTWAYEEYARTLQLLLHQRPAKHVVLKCPEHLWFIDDLLRVFPDACIVWTHRDPFDSIASYSSMISLNRRIYHGRVDGPALGAHIRDRFVAGLDRAMAARGRAGEDRFFDVDFRETVRDPIRVVRRIHEYFGLDHTEAGERRMEAWLATEREDARGRHVYDAARFGVDAADIHRRTRAYLDRFQISV